MYLEKFNTTVELCDLGDIRPELKGILSPVYSDDFVNKYIHEQFLEGSDHYVQRYQDCSYWKHLIQNSNPYLAIDPSSDLKILDIGSGAGNTVFPLLELFPNSHIIASDLSIPLLQALKGYASEYYKEKDLIVMQLNAEELIFKPGELDLIVGGAILHHLFDPSKTLREASEALKPGGSALFYEPFEAGYQLLGLMFKTLLRENGHRKWGKNRISDKIVKLFEAQINEFEMRKNPDKSLPIFQQVDDKWLFTKSYFEELGESLGFSEVIIYPLHRIEGAFCNQIKTILRLGAGADESALPQWAWDYAEEMDTHFSDQLKKELLIEGCVIFRK